MHRCIPALVFAVLATPGFARAATVHVQVALDGAPPQSIHLVEPRLSYDTDILTPKPGGGGDGFLVTVPDEGPFPDIAEAGPGNPPVAGQVVLELIYINGLLQGGHLATLFFDYDEKAGPLTDVLLEEVLITDAIGMPIPGAPPVVVTTFIPEPNALLLAAAALAATCALARLRGRGSMER